MLNWKRQKLLKNCDFQSFNDYFGTPKLLAVPQDKEDKERQRSSQLGSSRLMDQQADG